MREIKIKIGPSTGWLYAINDFSIASHISILRNAGATAIEVPLTALDVEDKRFDALLRQGSLQEADCLVYRSLHLPSYDGQTDTVAGLIIRLVDRHDFQTALIHPLRWQSSYPEEYYEILAIFAVPLAIENMDKNKDSGTSLKDLVYLVCKYNLGFVLDLQHAYELDNTMSYARDLAQALGDKLVHLHVSGESEDSNHSLLYQASNRAAIMPFLAEVFSQKMVPIILEGEYSNAMEIKQEISLIAKELCW